MIAQAQKASGMNGIEQGINFISRLAQGNPEVLDKIDFDAAVEEGLDLLGVPPVLLRDEEDTQRIRAQRQAVNMAQLSLSEQK